MTPVRERIHQMVDEFPDAELPAVESLLAKRRANVARMPALLADAPLDDEAVTPEEEAAVAAAYGDIAAGRVVSHDEARRRLLGDQ